MGGSPEALATASGRGNQPAFWDDPGSNRGCPDSHVESGDFYQLHEVREGQAVHVAITTYFVAPKLLFWCNRWVRFEHQPAQAKRERGSATSMRTAEVTICIISERLLDRP